MLSQCVIKSILAVLPNWCDLCRLPMHRQPAVSGGANHESVWFCLVCQQLFAAEPRCQQCGLPMTDEVEQCGACLKQPPPWRHLYCVSDYQFPLSTYIHRLKYHRQFWQAKPLAHILAERISQPAEFITWVPLHWQRKMTRGFNQSEHLGLALARQLNRPCGGLFKRTRSTPQQKGMLRKERLRNLRGAFQLRLPSSLPPSVSHVAIVDDVVTTGSTVQQLCQILLDAGVKTIDIYCICRTSAA